MRLRRPGLRNIADNRDACRAIAAWDGVLSIDGNPRTGSILVLYDPAVLAPMTAADRTMALLALPAQAAPAPVAAAGGNDSLLVSANRAAKIGMLMTMMGLLAALGVSKKLHAAVGFLHLGLLAVHLTRYRSSLLK